MPIWICIARGLRLSRQNLPTKAMGDSMALHLIRGTAYGDEGLLKRAIAEFQLALKSNPNDPDLHVAIADALYELHEYQEAINDLQESDKLAPGNGLVYAQLARCYAQLHRAQSDDALYRAGGKSRTGRRLRFDR